MRETLLKSEEFKDSPVGRIPQDWEVLKIATFASIKYGINDAIDQTLESGIQTITLPCVKSSGELVLDKEVLGLTSRYKVSPDDILQHGDLLFNWRNGSQEHLGKTAYFKASGEYTHIGFLLKIRTNTEICKSRYLWWRLCYMKDQGFFLKAKSQVNNTFNSAELAAVSIIIPPINEQQNIVEILDTIDSTIAQTTTLIAKLKQMKAGLLHDLLTRGLDENGELRDATQHPEQFKDSPLGRIPKDWEVEPFGEHIAQLDSGWSPVCNSEPAVNGEWGILKTTAVVWSGYNPLENKKLPSNLQPRYQAVVEADDILITRKGPRERVGVVVHIPLTPSQLMMPDTVFRVRLKESSTLLPAFVPLTLGSVAVQRDWNRKKIGLAEAQVDINYGIVRETLIYIPPKPEQERIVEIINNYNIRIRTEEAYRDKLKLQKQGLMHDLLTGKVRVNKS